MLGLIGCGHSLRAELAQRLYHHIKFGATQPVFDELVSQARLAQDLYPCNYRLCEWVAQKAWEQYAATNSTVPLKDVTEWATAAAGLNPYPRNIREVRRKCFEAESLREAISYWAEFVDWSFWDPYNHAVLLELYVRSGNVEGVLAEMKWVRNTAYASRAVELAQPLIAKEFTAPVSAR